MASGVSIADECLTAFNDMKLGRKYKYVIFVLSVDLKEVVVLSRGKLTETYEDFLTVVKSHEGSCFYAVYDFEYTNNDMLRQKLVFILWVPDDAHIRHKMVYTASKKALRQRLVGITVDMQANDLESLEIEEVVAKCCQRSQ